ncbi:MAG: alpha-glucosidase [Micavibrio sp.]|nr:MAG: alpha-glucosidase [Micavibrio sp.]
MADKKMPEHRPSEVIYQIYPSSFLDSSGDGLGDLKGILGKLDHIASLDGVDAVWISPFFLTPKGADGDGGYAITDYRKIDPKYGTMEDFKAVLDKAHELGLRVYTDFVLAHTAHDHEWFEKSRNREEPYTDYYVWHDGHIDEDGNRQPPNNWKSVFGGPAWSWDDKREQWYLHHFLKSQPALNNNLEKVQDAVLDEMRFWLDMGVDGFRLDAMPFANHDPKLRNNPWRDGQWPRDQENWEDQYFEHSICQPQTLDFIARIREMADSYAERKTTLGEAISGPDGGGDSVPVAASYADGEKGLSMCYTNALMSIWEYPDAKRIIDMVKHIEHHFPEGGNCNSASNHDIPRSASRMTKNIDDAHKDAAVRQLMELFISLPGSFCMYQGEELGLPAARIPEDIPLDKLQDPVAHTKGLEHSRDGARTPMPWNSGKKNLGFSTSDTPYLPVPNSHKKLAVDIQEKDPNSMLNFTRRLLRWRKDQPALKKGHTRPVENIPAPLLGFIRESREQSILCLFNMGSTPQSITLSDYFNETQCQKMNIRSGETVTLQAYGSAFYGDRPVAVKNTPCKAPKTGT